MSEFSYKFLKSLPKVELHCHLDGSVRVNTILELAKKNNVELPVNNHDDLKSYLEVGDDCKDLLDYLKAFSVTNSVLQTKEALARAAFELSEDAAEENIRILEIRFSPLLHTEKGLALSEIVEAVIEGKSKAEEKYNIKVGLILCGIRSMSPKRSMDLARVAISYKNKGVVAYDLAGPEENFPAKDHKEAFFEIINNNINTTVHAGEAYGPESIHQAIHYTRANRIGHGTRLREDPELLNFVNDHRIPLEMCVNCNVQTNTVASLADHPIKEYLDQGIRVTINTDNRLISKTTLTNEYKTVCDTFSLSNEELKKVILNGFKSVFLPYKECKDVYEKAESELTALGL
ncbi:MAG: adenosine deaminase [Flavobacteriales bacterium]|nr:adenosine deaminase [Flavobacteriales bacterium]